MSFLTTSTPTAALLDLPGITDGGILFDAGGTVGGFGNWNAGTNTTTLPGILWLGEVASAPTPSSGNGALFVKSSDSSLYYTDDSGTEYNILAVGNPAGSDGSIQFNSSGVHGADAANLHWNDANNRLGVGTNAPSNTLHVVGSFRVSSVSILQSNLTLVRDAGNLIVDVIGYTSVSTQSPRLQFKRARGTEATPTPAELGDRMGLVSASTRNPVSGAWQTGALIQFLATENHADAKYGTNVEIQTVPNGQPSLVTRMTISDIGKVDIHSDVLDMNSHNIQNVLDPVSAQDAATKAYVDASMGSMHDTATLNADAPTQDTLNLTGQEFQVNLATTSTAGAMSSADKTKLDGIDTNAADDQNASEVPFTPAGTLASTDVQAALEELDGDIQALTGTDDQNASEVPFTPAGNIAATDVQAALEELDSEKAPTSHNHTASEVTDFDTEVSNNTDVAANTTARHDALTLGGVASDTTDDTLDLSGQSLTVNLATGSTDGAMSAADKTKLDAIESGASADQNAAEVPFTPAGTLASTDVQAALEELDGDIQALTDTDDQNASEVPFTPTGSIAATDVQAAIAELDGDVTGINDHDSVTLNADGPTQDSLNLAGQEIQAVLATTSTAGVMSAADKTKLDGLSGSLTLGAATEIPFMNGAADDLAYDSDFIYFSSTNTINLGTLILSDAVNEFGLQNDVATDAAKAADIQIRASNKTGGTGDGGDVVLKPGTSAGGAAGSINASTSQINNVVDPTAAQDAATKNYVDTNAHDAVTLNADGPTQDSLNLAGQEIQAVLATGSTAGVMSAADKTKLDSIPASVTALVALFSSTSGGNTDKYLDSEQIASSNTLPQVVPVTGTITKLTFSSTAVPTGGQFQISINGGALINIGSALTAKKHVFTVSQAVTAGDGLSLYINGGSVAKPLVKLYY